MLFTAVWEREGKMAGTPKEEIKRIADQFAFTGELVSCGPCGSGHINETYMLRYRIGEMGSIKVILQKINREIFQKPEELMENIAGVTGHLKKKVLQKGGDPEREVLNLIPTKDGKAFLTDENGEYYMGKFDFSQIDTTQLSWSVETDNSTPWSEGIQMQTLEKLYARQILTDAYDYVRAIPQSRLKNKARILKKLQIKTEQN